MREPSFTIGIEEEYLLVDRASRDLVAEPPSRLLEECISRLPEGQVHPEFLRCQIEVSTGICTSLDEARRDLSGLRHAVSEVASRHGLGVLAASTHPFARWDMQKPTTSERYDLLARDFQGVARRLAICGMHVHVGIDDDELRIDLMNQAAYFLPHLLALSTSSPFWRGQDSGLKSYRLAVFNELPRTGLPEYFESWSEYQRQITRLREAGLMDEPSKLWWDLRPSARFPTLEMRITDVCTRLEDGLAIAALFRCLLRMLWRLRRANQRWRIYPRMLLNENRWRAQRYGIDSGLADFGRGAILPYPDLLDELLELVAEDARHFACEIELAQTRAILKRGTSAHRQLAMHRAALDGGADEAQALRQVVDTLLTETIADLNL